MSTCPVERSVVVLPNRRLLDEPVGLQLCAAAPEAMARMLRKHAASRRAFRTMTVTRGTAAASTAATG